MQCHCVLCWYEDQTPQIKQPQWYIHIISLLSFIMSANLSCLSLSEDQIQPPYTCIRGFNSGNSLYMTRMSQLIIIVYRTLQKKKINLKKHIVSWCSCTMSFLLSADEG